MVTPRRQRTIAGMVQVDGFGYWSGRDVSVRFEPAPAGHGLAFYRDDLDPQVAIPVGVAQQVDSLRRTTLGSGPFRVEMVEHILAALHGLHIDNCAIHVTAAEMPGCDGSAEPFVEALLRTDRVDQTVARAVVEVQAPLRVGEGEAWIAARPLTTAEREVSPLIIDFTIDYGSASPVGRQQVQLVVDEQTFVNQLAPARTFVLEHEAAWLRSQGLALRPTYADLIIFGAEGPIENRLRFADEPVRHKALDLIGDLALVGADIVGHFTAYCSGHKLNAAMSRELLDHYRLSQRRRSA